MKLDPPDRPGSAWPPSARRRLMARLAGPFEGGAPLHARYQPGAEVFPKMVFELDRAGPRAPEGQSLDYLRLLRRLWLVVAARQAGAPVSPRDAWLERLHAAVLKAQVLERELLGQLENDL